MIGKAKACSGGGALNNYVLDDEKGYELDRNGLCGDSPKEILEEMRIIQNMNTRAQNKTFSMVLSPDPKDGKNLSDKELKEMTREFMMKLGINPKEQQFIAFVHTEKEHKHIHIIANRVQQNGTLISDNHIGKKAQYAAHEIATSKGIISAKQQQINHLKEVDAAQNNLKGLKKNMYEKHLHILSQKPNSYEEYHNKMLSLGIKVTPTINKQGQIQGHRLIDIASGQSFKASEIHRNMGLKNLLEKGVVFRSQNQLTPALMLSLNIGVKISEKILKIAFKEITKSIGL